MLETKSIDLPVILPKGLGECERCIGRLRDSILQIEGVRTVQIDARNSKLTLVYDPLLVHFDDVENRVRRIGVELGERFEHAELEVTGLDCPDCALRLEKGIARLDGVVWVSSDFATSKLHVEYEPSRVDISTICNRIRTLGYSVGPHSTNERSRLELTGLRGRRWHRQIWLTVGSGICLIMGVVLSLAGHHGSSIAFYILSMVAGGVYAAKGAFYSARFLTPDMNFLVSVAALGAIGLGYWSDAAMVLFLFSLGSTLEARAFERTRQSIHSLISLFPSQTRVKRNSGEVMIATDEIRIGDIFIVHPGERIPTDGTVVSGKSAVNESPITGEPVPVDKSPGDKVFAGTLNCQGALEVVATATHTDNTLARIIHLVEEASAEKARAQRFSEAFGTVYTPIVIALALGVVVFGVLILKNDPQRVVYTALTLLIVSCPCALVISTPVSIVSAVGNAARQGMLIKGGSYLEAAATIRVIAMDKTGTVTTGNICVTDVIPAEGFTADEVLALAAGVENHSEHPIAQSIVREALHRNLTIPKTVDFEAITGMGAMAKIEGTKCLVGSAQLMRENDIPVPDDLVATLEEKGKTVVTVAREGRLMGAIGLMDSIRTSAPEALRLLRSTGIERIVMITGDNEAVARGVASQLNIDEWYADLRPEDKVDIVRALIEKHGSHVAVIGDGVNDAPALAAATVGIAIAAVGSHTALETADIALLSDDLSKLPYSLLLSRKTVRVIKQNIVFSLLVIASLMVMALLGQITLSMGILGHEASALIVIANSMRLLRFKLIGVHSN